MTQITSVTTRRCRDRTFGGVDRPQVLFDLAIGALKLGVDISVATPNGYQIPQNMREIIQESGKDAPIQGKLTETNVPEEAVRDADILVTDTWLVLRITN